jgi:hypothetical protein
MAETKLNNLIPLMDLVRVKYGRDVSSGTLHDWYTGRGLQLNGARLRVEKINNRIMCCEQWWAEFVSAVGHMPTVAFRTPRKSSPVVAHAGDGVESSRLMAEIERLGRENRRLEEENAQLRQAMKAVAGLLS